MLMSKREKPALAVEIIIETDERRATSEIA
jgi:hypothetical protein